MSDQNNQFGNSKCFSKAKPQGTIDHAEQELTLYTISPWTKFFSGILRFFLICFLYGKEMLNFTIVTA